MTYFDRDFELSEGAISIVLEKLGDKSALVLNEPYTCTLQTGKECTITGIEKDGDKEIVLITQNAPIPTTRLETSDLMDLVDTRISNDEFTFE